MQYRTYTSLKMACDIEKTVEILRIMIGEMAIMEKIWFAEYQKTGIPETVELPAENTSLVDILSVIPKIRLA